MPQHAQPGERSGGSELEYDGDEFRELVAQAMRRLEPFLASIAEQPGWDHDGIDDLPQVVREPLPTAGRPAGELFDLLFDTLIPKGYHAAGPGYLAFVPGGGLPEAAVADLIAGIVNRFVGVWQAAPGLAELEATVVRWIAEMIGYPAESGGFLTTGGSLANWSAIVTARRCRLPENFLNGTIYTSDQAHHSVAKAAMLSGFPERQVRAIPSDGAFRIDVGELRAAIARDREAGLQPFLIVGNAGTTNTGAVDDLNSLADVADEQNLWLHLDAAYGGFFMLTERGRDRLGGIDRADSITLDPHKGLFLAFGNGALLVRNAADLRAAHALDADYMPAMQNDPGRVDFCQISPELSRGFRGLRIWLPLKMHGVGAFRAALDEKLDLIAWATAELRGIPGIEIVAEPQLTIVAFRYNPGGADDDVLNALNRRLLEQINAGKRFLLTSTVVGGRFVIRICILNFRTHRDRVEECLQAIRRAAASAE